VPKKKIKNAGWDCLIRRKMRIKKAISKICNIGQQNYKKWSYGRNPETKKKGVCFFDHKRDNF